VSGQGLAAFEMPGNDANAKVPASIAGAGVTGMQMAFVDHVDSGRIECRLESLAYRLDSVTGHGRTLMNGCTSTEANAPSVA